MRGDSVRDEVAQMVLGRANLKNQDSGGQEVAVRKEKILPLTKPSLVSAAGTLLRPDWSVNA